MDSKNALCLESLPLLSVLPIALIVWPIGGNIVRGSYVYCSSPSRAFFSFF